MERKMSEYCYLDPDFDDECDETYSYDYWITRRDLDSYDGVRIGTVDDFEYRSYE
jgi:hypothetical protein